MKTNTSKKLVITTLMVVFGLGSFLVTIYAKQEAGTNRIRPRHGRQRAMASWLNLDKVQMNSVYEADPAFHSESDALNKVLANERKTLAEMLENPETESKAILDQVERVIAAGNELERRVAKYVVSIRPHLTTEQQKKLFDLCAKNVRQCGGCGKGRNSTGGGGQGQGKGRGHGGQGRGGGGHGRMQQP